MAPEHETPGLATQRDLLKVYETLRRESRKDLAQMEARMMNGLASLGSHLDKHTTQSQQAYDAYVAAHEAAHVHLEQRIKGSERITDAISVLGWFADHWQLLLIVGGLLAALSTHVSITTH